MALMKMVNFNDIAQQMGEAVEDGTLTFGVVGDETLSFVGLCHQIRTEYETNPLDGNTSYLGKMVDQAVKVVGTDDLDAFFAVWKDLSVTGVIVSLAPAFHGDPETVFLPMLAEERTMINYHNNMAKLRMMVDVFYTQVPLLCHHYLSILIHYIDNNDAPAVRAYMVPALRELYRRGIGMKYLVDGVLDVHGRPPVVRVAFLKAAKGLSIAFPKETDHLFDEIKLTDPETAALLCDLFKRPLPGAYRYQEISVTTRWMKALMDRITRRGGKVEDFHLLVDTIDSTSPSGLDERLGLGRIAFGQYLDQAAKLDVPRVNRLLDLWGANHSSSYLKTQRWTTLVVSFLNNHKPVYRHKTTVLFWLTNFNIWLSYRGATADPKIPKTLKWDSLRMIQREFPSDSEIHNALAVMSGDPGEFMRAPI
jgi:hypothetical protein